MKIKNKILSIITATMLATISTGVSADEFDNEYYENRIGNLLYEIFHDEVTIVGCDETVKEIVIPETIDGMPVKGIESFAFWGCCNLKNISIPSSIDYIYPEAFDDTAWYKSQPDGVVYIGNILYDYKGDIPDNTSIKIKEGTVSISPNAFSGEIDEETFEIIETDGLISVEIPDSIKIIGAQSFESCTNLSEISFPSAKSVKIEDNAFYNTEWYNSQPDGIVYIGDVLYKYKGEIPMGTNLVLPDSVKSIADSAFVGEIDLFDIFINPDQIAGCAGLESIALPDGLEYIGNAAFSFCVSLTKINIPESVKEIGDAAFVYDVSLTDLVLPNGIKTIGAALFAECTALKSIKIPESVTFIDFMAFYDTGIIDIEVPMSVKNIYFGAFYAPKLNNITIKNPRCEIEYEPSTISNYIDEEMYDYCYSGTITGYKNSFAYIYSQLFEIKFNPEFGIIGDVNGSGKIDLYDAIEIAKYMLNKVEFDENKKMIADYSLDGKINLYDVIGVAQAILQKNN